MRSSIGAFHLTSFGRVGPERAGGLNERTRRESGSKLPDWGGWTAVCWREGGLVEGA